MFLVLLYTLSGVVLSLVFAVFVIRVIAAFRRKAEDECVVAFFHPFCNSGGGGERVLWKAIDELKALKAEGSLRFRVLVYTGDREARPKDILKRAADRFNLEPYSSEDVSFVYLDRRRWVQAALYPRFTLLGQSLGSLVLGWEALWKRTPHVFIDTTGYAFTYPLAKLVFGCRVASYTHYPTISTDMLAKVLERRPTYNNSGQVAQSATLSTVKSLYYRLFAFLYGMVGWFADVVMVNSSWTAGHIRRLWGDSDRIRVVYPPCDTTTLQTLELQPRERVAISLGQFRPEKDHALQLRAFARFIEMSAGRHDDVKLVLIGGCRNDGDRQRVADLRELAEELGIKDRIDFRLNVPFSELKRALATALVGLHTMWNEHFGIGVVEFMAAGVVTIAHNSGGPKADIVARLRSGQETGYLATTPDEYATMMLRVFDADSKGDHLLKLRRAAREHVLAFSDENFMQAFGAAVGPLLSTS